MLILESICTSVTYVQLIKKRAIAWGTKYGVYLQGLLKATLYYKKWYIVLTLNDRYMNVIFFLHGFSLGIQRD